MGNNAGDKIIKKFPLEELNLILGGIMERSVYYFNLIIRKADSQDQSLELIKDLSFRDTDIVIVLRNFFNKFASSFGITMKDESMLIINYLKIAKEVRRYFRNIEVDIDSIYDNHKDIYEFMEYLNNNPIIKELERKISEVNEKNGSIIVFNVTNGFRIDELNYIETPEDFAENNIMVYADKILFDNIITILNDEHHTYPYPFSGIQETDLHEVLFSKTTKFLKSLSFDIELEDVKPEFRKNHITHYYSFTKSFNILNCEIVTYDEPRHNLSS